MLRDTIIGVLFGSGIAFAFVIIITYLAEVTFNKIVNDGIKMAEEIARRDHDDGE